MDGRPWLSQSNLPRLTSPPDTANNHLLGDRRQRISTNYATPPAITALTTNQTDAPPKLKTKCCVVGSERVRPPKFTGKFTNFNAGHDILTPETSHTKMLNPIDP